MSDIDRDRLPSRPGIVVLYRERHAAWTVKSADVRATFGQLLAAQGPSALSPLRRKVASFLGISTPTAIAAGRYRPTAEDHARISRWIRECTAAWIECATETETVALEAALLAASDAERMTPGANGDAPPPRHS